MSLPVTIPYAGAANASDLAAQLSSRGLTATASGSTVTVTGSASVGTTGIGINIDNGVTVNWNANLDGRATANNYLLTLSGSGIFNLTGGTLSNTTGAGGTLYIADRVTVNISGGLIDSPGAGSAVTINAGVQGAVINVGGSGTIRSTPSGYAINDGSGMTASNNNTIINVTGGLVEAGNACAIRSTGIASVVNISGGEVRNAAASNTNSTIYMNYAPAPNNNLNNIVISGGLVRTTNEGNQSYVVQSSQNILVCGNGDVRSLSGRTINLVGLYSVATITDNAKVTTETGTAVSTATTTLDDITNAKIVISGNALVEATGKGTSDFSGTAVRITGTNSTVEVSGNALVLAKSGLAIDASGRPQPGSVRVNGGLVYAWGNGTNKVVSPGDRLNSSVGGYVVAWNTTNGVSSVTGRGPDDNPYIHDEDADLISFPSGSAKWEIVSGKNDGFSYAGKYHSIGVLVIPSTHAYNLIVINSPGAGDIIRRTVMSGETVTIEAVPEPIRNGVNPNLYPINGNHFKWWSSSDPVFGLPAVDGSINNSETFVMPSHDVVISAVFHPLYLFAIQGGVMSAAQEENFIPSEGRFGGSKNYGYFEAGSLIHIDGTSRVWAYGVKWTSTLGGSFDDDEERITVFTMPDNPVVVYPTDVPAPNPANRPEKHTTTITSPQGIMTGTTGGTPVTSQPPGNEKSHTDYSGTGVFLNAQTPPLDHKFDCWEIVGVGDNNSLYDRFIDRYSPITVFIMPNVNVELRATFVHIDLPTSQDFELRIINGFESGSGRHRENESVLITANSAPAGMVFSGWVIEEGGGYFDDPFDPSATYYMPDNDAVISAHFEFISFELTVEYGLDATGNGKYHYGEIVNIVADIPDGMHFWHWETNNGGTFGNAEDFETTFTMPAGNVTVTAFFDENPPPIDNQNPPDNGDPLPDNGGPLPDNGDPPPTTPTARAGSSPLPRTGIQSDFALWVTLALISLASVIIVTKIYKRMNR